MDVKGKTNQHPAHREPILGEGPSTSASVLGQKAHLRGLRPVRTLSRRDTQKESQLNPQVFIDRWQSGPFADAPEKRIMRMGPKLFTEGHEDLLRRLRMEGARVSQGMAEAQREATLTYQRHQETWDKLQKMRGELHATRQILTVTQEELEAAQVVLNEMDNAWAQSQHHRMSRILAIDSKKEQAASKNKTDDQPARVSTPDLCPTKPDFTSAP